MKYNTLKRLEKLESIYQTTVEDKRFRQAREEVEALMDAFTARYNSPEEKAKRKAFDEEVHRIGELRKQAFYSGKSWDDLPLPWENDPEKETFQSDWWKV